LKVVWKIDSTYAAPNVGFQARGTLARRFDQRSCVSDNYVRLFYATLVNTLAKVVQSFQKPNFLRLGILLSEAANTLKQVGVYQNVGRFAAAPRMITCRY
jgi:hypothetical protein